MFTDNTKETDQVVISNIPTGTVDVDEIGGEQMTDTVQVYILSLYNICHCHSQRHDSKPNRLLNYLTQ